MQKRHFLGIFTAFLLFSAPVHAAALNFASDLISTSQPTSSSTSIGANHTVTFSVPTPIPPSGKIVITPESGFFNIPAGFDHLDVDFATATSLAGTYVDRAVAAAADAANDGIAVVTGTGGSFTITLNSTTGIAAGDFLRFKFGSHATTGGTGDSQIANPQAVRSYSINLETKSDTGTALDDRLIWIAIVNPVTLGPIDTTDYDPPVRSNGLPSGSSIPAGITGVEISLNTDEQANCRYATFGGIDFDSMTSVFPMTFATLHVTTVGGLVDGQTYGYYVRCKDRQGNKNPDDYLLSFTIGLPLPSPGPGPGRGAGPGGGSPGDVVVPGGISGGLPYPPSPSNPQLTLSGFAYPSSKVSILKDGKVAQEVSADTSGVFSSVLTTISQGVYTFGIWAEDSQGRKSITYSATISLVAGTKTSIGNILLPPTMSVENTALVSNEPIRASGEAAPGSKVEVQILPIISGNVLAEEIVKQEVVVDTQGRWTASISAANLILDTYQIRARAYLEQTGYSIFGQEIILTREGSADFCRRSDVNDDGRVNFVDFSILLFNWGGQNARVDINQDGKINLADFSIMLTCWTG